MPETERAAAEVLSLPLYPEITVAQQQRVVHVLTRAHPGIAGRPRGVGGSR